MQQQSMVRRAADEFTRGNYLAALDLYRRLAEQLGERNFRVNIWLCEKRAREQGRRDCTNLPLRAMKVACVMDEFTFHCYEPECNLFPLTPEHATEELEAFSPDLLFIESAWRGKDELWNRKIGTLSQELRAVLQWCKQRQVPTVFWNKEDPVHFETFLTTAQQFDFVFTTDIDCIARYKAALGHERVYLLPFACQPKTHNPIELYPRKDAFCFAGAYYVRYPERTRDLETYVAEFPKFKPLEIFDRNFGKDDVNYQFPPEYQPFIVGTLPFNEIDKAYKGYRYSINLNSIKQSQTMFARRVFELLGSNTITVSNFSRGVRLLFGDLVIASDSGKEIVDRLQGMDDEAEQKLRLAALRKVMLEHTYGHRLGYVALKVFGRTMGDDLPTIVAVAMVGSEDEYRWVLNNYKEQKYVRKRLLLVLTEGVHIDRFSAPEDAEISVVEARSAGGLRLGEFVDNDAWVAILAPEDYYGANYLLDLAIATKYSGTDVVGKARYYEWTLGGIREISSGSAYLLRQQIPARCGAIRAKLLPVEQLLLPWLREKNNTDWGPGLATDPFNYCRWGKKNKDLAALQAIVDDVGFDSGITIDKLYCAAEEVLPAEFDESGVTKWDAAKLMQAFGKVRHPHISFENVNGEFVISSTLPDGRHEYIYSGTEIPVEKLLTKGVIDTHLDVTPGLNIQYVFVFLDSKKQKLAHVIHTSNRNHTAPPPAETTFVRIGLRIYGSGSATTRALLWGHRHLEPARLVSRSDTLLVTNHYPSYDDLYKNGFVHSRVRAYRERLGRVDVFRLRPNESVSYHEFENVDVLTGSQRSLHKLLSGGGYKAVLVHFLSQEMWEVMKEFPSIRVIVWVHGAEIHPWYRREYNYSNEQERISAKRASDQRIAFWKDLLRQPPTNLKLVFVSRYFAEEVMADLGFRLPDEAYMVIHNPIDTTLFSYQPKPAAQRKRLLSIRPFASRQYANDITVAAILHLAKNPIFRELEFRIIGDGKLFDELISPLRDFDNVKVERRFVTHAEMSLLHKEYGVFLCPTRWDSQGVSRDEAMSSGLVPITNSIAAIPEFVDESSAIIVPPEDAAAMAAGIISLVTDSQKFCAMSEAAAQRVRSQSDLSKIIEQEVRLIKGDV